MSSRDRARNIMQASRDKLNKIADENGKPEYDDWAGLEGRGINADLIGPKAYYDNTKTAASVRHTYMDQYKGENGSFAYLGDWNDGIPDNDDGEPTGDKVLTREGNDWCKYNGGILGDTKELIGDVSDSVYIRQEGDNGMCLPLEYARSQVNEQDSWPVQDDNGALNKKGRPCAGAKHIKYKIANNILDCYYENLDKQILSDLYNRKGDNKQHADTARQVITKYCSHPENINNAITDDKTCEDMIDEYSDDGEPDGANDDDETNDDDTNDDETDDDETDDEEDDDGEDYAAVLAAAEAARKKEAEEAAAEQRKLFALIALVVLLLCSSSAAAALVIFNM